MPQKKLRLERQAQELQCTIIKLREELEKSLINKKSAIDSLQQTHDLNVREFEKTIQSLRMQNQNERLNEDERTQKAVATLTLKLKNFNTIYNH